MRRIVIVLSIIAVCTTVSAQKPRRGSAVTMDSTAMVESLRRSVDAARDSLQAEIAARWGARQRQVGQREADRDELARLREEQERGYNALARIREECLALEQSIEERRIRAAERAEAWKQTAAIIDDLASKQAERVMDAFVLDRETRRLQLERIRGMAGVSDQPAQSFEKLLALIIDGINAGCSTTIQRADVALDVGGVEQLTVARFGSVFGYALNAQGKPFTIRQTGRMGAARFAVDSIGHAELAQFVVDSLPRWISLGYVSGPVVLDVLQNSRSVDLTGGQQRDRYAAAREFFRSGGPVMIPLAVLPLWALAIIVIKLVQLGVRRRQGRRIFRLVWDRVEKNDPAGARSAVESSRSAAGRIAAACLAGSRLSRTDIEKRVQAVFIEELPRLNRFLDTLALIAAVAPLLGLLGTVSGMINLFAVITNYGTGDPKLMAGGIAEALVTTQVGLCIAIPIMLAHNFLRNRRNDLKAEMERQAIRLLNRVVPHEQATGG